MEEEGFNKEESAEERERERESPRKSAQQATFLEQLARYRSLSTGSALAGGAAAPGAPAASSPAAEAAEADAAEAAMALGAAPCAPQRRGGTLFTTESFFTVR